MSSQGEVSAIQIQTSQRINDWLQEKNYGNLTFSNKMKDKKNIINDENDSYNSKHFSNDESTTDTTNKMDFYSNINIYKGLTDAEISSLRNTIKDTNKSYLKEKKNLNKLSKRKKIKEHLKNTIYKIRKKRLNEKMKLGKIETNSDISIGDKSNSNKSNSDKSNSDKTNSDKSNSNKSSNDKSKDALIINESLNVDESLILNESSCYSKFKSKPRQLSLLFNNVMNNGSHKLINNSISNNDYENKSNIQNSFLPELNYFSFQKMGNSIYETFNYETFNYDTSNYDEFDDSNIKSEAITKNILKRDLSEDLLNEYPSKRQHLTDDTTESDENGSENSIEKKENQIFNSTEFVASDGKSDLESKDKSFSLEELSLRTYSTRESSISTTSSKVYSIPTFKNERYKLTIADIVESLYHGVVTDKNVVSNTMNEKLNYNYQNENFFQELPDNFFDKSEISTNLLFNPVNTLNNQINEDNNEKKNPSIRFNDKCSLLVYKKKERPKTVNSSIILPEYKSILKKKENKRKDIELMKVEQCDKVDVKCFFQKFYESENRKMEEDDKYQKVRERQLDRYYKEENSLSILEKNALKGIDSNQQFSDNINSDIDTGKNPNCEKVTRTLKGVCIIKS